MIRTPPEANTEYSRAPKDPRGISGAESRVLLGVLVGGLLAAVLLVVAEFTTLYTVRTTTGATVVKTVGVGSNHSYALLPIAVLVAFLSYAVWRAVSRPALLSLGVLGVIVLLISLLGDLPDAHASGLIGSSVTHFASANSRPSAGFYMETLAAVLLLITCVSGFLLLGTPSERRAGGPGRPPRGPGEGRWRGPTL
jgi:hypothetical protein